MNSENKKTVIFVKNHKFHEVSFDSEIKKDGLERKIVKNKKLLFGTDALYIDKKNNSK